MDFKEQDREKFLRENPTHGTFYTTVNSRKVRREERLQAIREQEEKKEAIKLQKVEDRINKIKAFRKKHYSLEKIGKLLGVTRERARQLERMYGFPPRKTEKVVQVMKLVRKKCKECGKVSYVINSLKRKKFCSRECFFKNILGMKHTLSPEELRKYHRERRRKYYRTKNGKKATQRASRKSAKKFREKVLARAKLNHYVKIGIVKKPKKCSNCGQSELRITGHHPDYSKPLEVKWLCDLCHREEHRKLDRKIKNNTDKLLTLK